MLAASARGSVLTESTHSVPSAAAQTKAIVTMTPMGIFFSSRENSHRIIPAAKSPAKL